ncbi:helix-turn-helix transcriptional regulator [Nitrosomonas sp. JL21]|uniref:helix-turn-helix transcriptional regulator n=1 Tax=Nitrosomonas sp. JL21 TaxID=153949 RepID=UPI00136AFA8F|nr:LuxR C-terminal-related transcriptional regulator [Nitrosomonas sp. JL21]MBL8496627.1 hypothetical protein [Nitrosomonas sp.]MCC7092511.1 hypothetical protein [Nitrosomonas sp.]MXS76458.1 helix-turn-helix transcriptional regulator [Nitrosomonas sp. JL21]
MTYDLEKVNALIARIYDAALDDTLWPSLVHTLAQIVNAEDSIMFGSPEVGNHQMVVLSPLQNAAHDAAQAYGSYFWEHDKWKTGAAQHQLTYSGAIFHGDQFIDRHSFQNTEIYTDFFKPMMNGTGVVLTSIIEEATHERPNPVILSFYKSFLAQPFNQKDEDLIRLLMPHFQRSLFMRRRMNEERELRQFSEQVLHHSKDAILLLDATCRVHFANRKAELMLSRGNPTVKQGYLRSSVSSENSALMNALRNALEGKGCVLKFSNIPFMPARVALFSPVSGARGEQLHTPARIMVVITEPDKFKGGGLDDFAKMYRLTPAETRVLNQLLQQQSTHEIAEVLHISMNTLRTHLKILFAKTSTKNQRELVNFCRSHPNG